LPRQFHVFERRAVLREQRETETTDTH
jgi:hypothetical protein